MRLNTVLLISRDHSLAKSIQKSLDATTKMRLAVLSNYDEASALLNCTEVVLVLAHLTVKRDVDMITGLVRAQAAERRKSATVVIGEPALAEQGLALLRRGVADYLERPLDISRLDYLLDALTVRARYEAAATAPSTQQPVEVQDYLYSPHEAMAQIMDQVNRVATVNTNILLQGETGSGKTRLARV